MIGALTGPSYWHSAGGIPSNVTADPAGDGHLLRGQSREAPEAVEDSRSAEQRRASSQEISFTSQKRGQQRLVLARDFPERAVAVREVAGSVRSEPSLSGNIIVDAGPIQPEPENALRPPRLGLLPHAHPRCGVPCLPFSCPPRPIVPDFSLSCLQNPPMGRRQ